MGTWHITIHGHGIHHNGRKDDANEMLKTFVRGLIAAGHDVHRAEFTLTGTTDDVADECVAAATNDE